MDCSVGQGLKILSLTGIQYVCVFLLFIENILPIILDIRSYEDIFLDQGLKVSLIQVFFQLVSYH